MAIARITAKGREKLCKAHAGAITLPKISQMAFGTGGREVDGSMKPILGTEETLYNEALRKDIESFTFPSGTTCRYAARVDKLELINVDITELGLFDEDGDLIVYKTCPPKQKDEDEEFVFYTDEIF